MIRIPAKLGLVSICLRDDNFRGSTLKRGSSLLLVTLINSLPRMERSQKIARIPLRYKGLHPHKKSLRLYNLIGKDWLVAALTVLSIPEVITASQTDNLLWLKTKRQNEAMK